MTTPDFGQRKTLILRSLVQATEQGKVLSLRHALKDAGPLNKFLGEDCPELRRARLALELAEKRDVAGSKLKAALSHAIQKRSSVNGHELQWTYGKLSDALYQAKQMNAAPELWDKSTLLKDCCGRKLESMGLPLNPAKAASEEQSASNIQRLYRGHRTRREVKKKREMAQKKKTKAEEEWTKWLASNASNLLSDIQQDKEKDKEKSFSPARSMQAMKTTRSMNRRPKAKTALKGASDEDVDLAVLVEDLYYQKEGSLVDELRSLLVQAHKAKSSRTSDVAVAEPLRSETILGWGYYLEMQHKHHFEPNHLARCTPLGVLLIYLASLSSVDIDRTLLFSDVPPFTPNKDERARTYADYRAMVERASWERNPDLFSKASSALISYSEALQNGVEEDEAVTAALSKHIKFLCCLTSLRKDFQPPTKTSKLLRGLSEQELMDFKAKKTGDKIFWPSPTTTTIVSAQHNEVAASETDRCVCFEISNVTQGIDTHAVSPYSLYWELLLSPFTLLEVEKVESEEFFVRISCRYNGTLFADEFCEICQKDLSDCWDDLVVVQAQFSLGSKSPFQLKTESQKETQEAQRKLQQAQLESQKFRKQAADLQAKLKAAEAREAELRKKLLAIGDAIPSTATLNSLLQPSNAPSSTPTPTPGAPTVPQRRSIRFSADLSQVVLIPGGGLSELVADATVKKLGLTFTASPPEPVMVKALVPGSWSATAGFTPGDEIVSLNGRAVAQLSADSFRQQLQSERPLRFLVRPASGGSLGEDSAGAQLDLSSISSPNPTASDALAQEHQDQLQHQLQPEPPDQAEEEAHQHQHQGEGEEEGVHHEETVDLVAMEAESSNGGGGGGGMQVSQIMEFMAGEEVEKLGVAFNGSPPDAVTIKGLQNGSWGSTAGFQVGDSLLSLNGIALEELSQDDFKSALKDIRPLTFMVSRTTAAQEDDPDGGLIGIEADESVDRLGLAFNGTPPEEAVMIKAMQPGSWSESAGFVVNDEVVTLNGVALSEMPTDVFKQLLKEQRPLRFGIRRV